MYVIHHIFSFSSIADGATHGETTASFILRNFERKKENHCICFQVVVDDVQKLNFLVDRVKEVATLTRVILPKSTVKLDDIYAEKSPL